MSYNRNFYNNFRGNEYTFQNNSMGNFVPPPPPPPNFFMPPTPVAPYTPALTDQEYIKRFESIIPPETKVKKPTPISISEARNKLKDIILMLNNIKEKENYLSKNINTCSDEEWKSKLGDINHNKELINKSVANISLYLDILRKALAKRAAKRLRLKKLRAEQKREREDRNKMLKEKSRKIDENLQKIKDSIIKAKQEADDKLQADVVLKETLRKKHDAKKCIAKLDALMKLRSAREKTAKGRGQQVSEKDAEELYKKIDNLKSLWTQKLVDYEKEEEELRTKLKEDSQAQNAEVGDVELKVIAGLGRWRRALFGHSTATPQADFHGDLARFVAVRYQWDKYLSEEGSSLPVGWVCPSQSR